MANNEDINAWKREIASVTPLKGKAGELESETPDLQDDVMEQKAISTPSALASHVPVKGSAFGPLRVGDLSAVDGATARKLKRGQMPIAATLDLHGLTQAEAIDALEHFILAQSGGARRLVLIITGKGSLSNPSILKQNLPLWLGTPTLRPHILCLTEATAGDGGSGAFYVLLRKSGL